MLAAASNPGDLKNFLIGSLALGSDGFLGFDPALRVIGLSNEISIFAEEVFASRSIPLEQSPFDLRSLSDLVEKSNLGAGLAAALVTIDSPRKGLLVLLIYSGCVILCGATNAIARALAAGLEHHLKRLMGVPPEKILSSTRRKTRQRKGP